MITEIEVRKTVDIWKMRLSFFFEPSVIISQGRGGKGCSSQWRVRTLALASSPSGVSSGGDIGTLRLIAYETGVAYSHLINAANGITPPSPQLRQKLSEFLDLPIEKLFTADALTARYKRGPSRRRQDQPQVRKARGLNAGPSRAAPGRSRSPTPSTARSWSASAGRRSPSSSAHG
jgi:transcriptional regulator with XRE-family HTH domain